MYLAFFGLREKPFSITPDPRFLFLSQRHRDALAYLLYGMGEGGGFVQLTGEVGTGKTTICRSVLEQAPGEVDVALVLNPKVTAVELVATICDELRIAYPPATTSLKLLVDRLNQHLLQTHAKGRRTVLIIDEAQNLNTEVLEQIRLLTNLETATQKLLQIILIGQPELQDLLARADLRQLNQRITARYHLTPLSVEETAAYVRHRLDVAGLSKPLFTRRALKKVHRVTGGIPRLINVICEYALLGAYARQSERIDARFVTQGAAEATGQSLPDRPKWAIRAAVAGAALGAVATMGILLPGPPIGRLGMVGSEIPVAPTPLAERRTESGLKQPTPRGEQPTPAPGIDEGTQIVLADLLGDDTVATDTETAFRTLFAHWNLEYSDYNGATACARAVHAGLQCLHGHASLQTMRLYNRPAVLELFGDDGRRHHLVLSALDGERATLDIAERQLTVNLHELGALWRGSYILLWTPPPSGSTLLVEGSSGPDIQWLRSQLDSVSGHETLDVENSPYSSHFDEGLRRRVIDFQRAHGLVADGAVGPQTLIQLATTVGEPSGPVLQQTTD